MVTGIVLVVLAVACRLLAAAYHLWNFVPVGAVALYAGSRLPRRWAWGVPITALVLSDPFLPYAGSWPLFSPTRWTIYGTLAAMALMGRLANNRRFRTWMLPGLAVSGSVLFFVTTNFSTWAEGQLYPMTWAGLATCYIKGIPFYRPTLAADLIGTCALFGLGSAIERAVGRVTLAWGRKPVVVEVVELREMA